MKTRVEVFGSFFSFSQSDPQYVSSITWLLSVGAETTHKVSREIECNFTGDLKPSESGPGEFI